MDQNKQEVLFSIIMPCYNSEAYVRNAIDSVVNQSYKMWELVVVNDGSTDSTLEILNSYAKNDNRIKVFSKENGGYVSAVNYALDRISGTYFLMMGSDDRLSTDLLLQLVENIGEELPDIIAFRAVKFVDGKQREVDSNTNFDTVSYMCGTISEYEKQYPKHARIMFVRDTCKCFKTQKLGNLRYFGKYGYDADGVFSALFTHKCCSFMSVPINGYYWTVRGDSLSAKKNVQIHLDRLFVWTEYNKYILGDNTYIPTEYEKSYFKYEFGVGNILIKELKYLDRKTKNTIHSARKSSAAVCKKFSVLNNSPRDLIKKISVKLPNIYTYTYRICMRKRGK